MDDDETSKEYWTRSKIYKLIDLYKGQDCLWNVGNPYYRDKRKRIAAWKTIATAIGFDVMSVERKIKVLKTQFMHCYKLYKKYSISGESYHPKWFAYNSLKFLIPAKIFRENREISRLQENGLQLIKSESIETSPISLEENNSTIESQERHNVTDNSWRNTSQNNPPLNHALHYQDETPGHPGYRSADVSHGREQYDNTRDEYAIFGELIACRLRKLEDPRSRLTVQLNINNLLFDAQMREIDRVNGPAQCDDRALNGVE